MATYGMGIGTVGAENQIFKRKFRWVFSIDGQQMWYAKVGARPNLTIDETEIHHLHERHMISGKPVWENLSLTIFDVKPTSTSLGGSEEKLHEWLNTVWKFSREIGAFDFMAMGDHDSEYKQDLTIRMLDGHGEVMETWWLLGAWPQTVNWGDLDYSSSDTADVEITVRYDRAEFKSGEGGRASGGAA